jgi:hypothetical protein
VALFSVSPGQRLLYVVELRGLEPLTSSMPLTSGPWLWLQMERDVCPPVYAADPAGT